MGELQLAALLCAFLANSEDEVRHAFDVYGSENPSVRADCETKTHVIELGLDEKVSARDSVHQALFYAYLTGKKPAVILIDRDGYEGRYEYEMRHVTAAARVTYLRCGKETILRWAATSGARDAGRSKAVDDIPLSGPLMAVCDLRPLF